MLLAHPFLEMGFIDDFSYIKTAQVFARTGHLVYNGWATASLGWQVLWGALFARLFGFSFVHVRLSTLPVAMACVYIFHQILVRFGISRGNAVFGSLSLALSPVFFAMSATYFTDVPGVFITLLCLYLCQRAISTAADHAALGWLFLAAVTNIGGGTVRQTAWLGVLVIFPSAVWLLRRRSLVLCGGTLLWLFGAGSVFALMRWFNQQPYFLPESIPINRLFQAATLGYTVLREVGLGGVAFLCILLLLLPILVTWLPVGRSGPNRKIIWLIAISSVVMTIFLASRAAHGALGALGEFDYLAPWMPHVLRSVMFPYDYGQRIIVTELVLASAFVLFLQLFRTLRMRGQLARGGAPPWSHIFCLLAPYTVAYIGALIIRGLDDIWFDRYLLTLQAIGIIFLLRYYQDFTVCDRREMRSRFGVGGVSAVSWLVLLAFAFFGVAGTHDWFAMYRARLQAAEEIRQSGVPRTAILGGFEYDGWTQIEGAGYINDHRIRIPASAFRLLPPPSFPIPACAVNPWFVGDLTPIVVPEYFVVDSPKSCLDSAPFPAVPYHKWLPPWTGWMYVQKRKS